MRGRKAAEPVTPDKSIEKFLTGSTSSGLMFQVNVAVEGERVDIMYLGIRNIYS